MKAADIAAIQPNLRLCLAALAALALALAMASPARAERALLPSLELKTEQVPGGQIEGACGVAVIGTTLYVSDYYHHGVDLFNFTTREYVSRMVGDPLDGPCALATSASGALYAEDWHAGVSRLLPSTLAFGSPRAQATGVAVDQASGRVYVDERTQVGVYEPSGAFVMDIGTGTLEDGYGVAVAAGKAYAEDHLLAQDMLRAGFAKVYVPDAAAEAVKVYEPAVDPVNPTSTISGADLPGGGFHSLADAAVAIDPTNQHLLVVDNLQPGFEHPEAAIDEFGAGGEFLSPLGARIIDGEPSGLYFSAGTLYVTSGNDSFSGVLRFGPYTVGGSSSSALADLAAPAAPAASSVAAATASVLRLPSSGSGSAHSAATIRVLAPGPGTFSASGPGLKPLQALRVGPGPRVLRLRLDRRGRLALRRARRHRLELTVTVTFTADGGASISSDQVLSFLQRSGGQR